MISKKALVLSLMDCIVLNSSVFSLATNTAGDTGLADDTGALEDISVVTLCGHALNVLLFGDKMNNPKSFCMSHLAVSNMQGLIQFVCLKHRV